jgi:hypothetical protein
MSWIADLKSIIGLVRSGEYTPVNIANALRGLANLVESAPDAIKSLVSDLISASFKLKASGELEDLPEREIPQELADNIVAIALEYGWVPKVGGEQTGAPGDKPIKEAIAWLLLNLGPALIQKLIARI